MQLTSPQNPILKSIRRAAGEGRPTPDGLVVIEGPHLLEEASRSPWQVEQIFCTAEAGERFADMIELSGAEVIRVSARALSSAASTESSQQILALVRPRIWSWPDLLRGHPLVVVLDAIQDAGNAGTIVRSAEAFGASGVILLTGTCRASNGKFLRASAGSAFRQPFLENVSSQQFLKLAKESSLKVYSLAMEGGTHLLKADFGSRAALVVGNEGSGVSPALLQSSQAITIPTLRVESLNAAVACSVALYEAATQRRGA